MYKYIYIYIYRVYLLRLIRFFRALLPKASLHSYYIPVIVYNKYLTVKRLFRWQTTDDGLV